jgi:hypothetical protein
VLVTVFAFAWGRRRNRRATSCFPVAPESRVGRAELAYSRVSLVNRVAGGNGPFINDTIDVGTAVPSVSSAFRTKVGTLPGILRVGRHAESRKQRATKLLRKIPCIGAIRAALLIALIQTPHRFRTKRQLWNYSGLGDRNTRQCAIPLRSRRATTFPETATTSRTQQGPFHDFYEALLVKGRKPTMARLTLARKLTYMAGAKSGLALICSTS